MVLVLIVVLFTQLYITEGTLKFKVEYELNNLFENYQ